MKKLLELFFGARVKGEKVQEPRFHSVYPSNPISKTEWFKEFRVGSLHNVAVVHLDQDF